MNQGMVKKRWGVKFYALAISVFAHIVALSVFAAVKLTQTPAVPLQATATVSISQARQLAQSPAVTPKPKVAAPAQKDNPVISKMDSPLRGLRRLRGNNKIVRGNDKGQTDSQPVIESPQLYVEGSNPQDKPGGFLPGGIDDTAQVEFFDNTAQGRRICYVVDCSGSMQGLWRRVRAELVESIGQLQQDQYFCVIVFGAGSILESNGGKMARASEQAKKEALGFINSLRPAGATNALAAIQQAVKVRDQREEPASVIYFLTDGFELSEQDGSRFAHQVATMLRSFSPKTRINTIGLWPSEQDRRTLETIARESGGRWTLIESATPILGDGEAGENQ